MAASVTGKKRDFLSFERSDDVGIRWIAEGRLKLDLLLRLKPGHRVQATAADDSNLCLLFQLSILLHSDISRLCFRRRRLNKFQQHAAG